MGTTLTVTAKGQVTLRKELLEHIGVEPGEKILVEFLPAARVQIRAAKSQGSIESFIGCLQQPGTQPLSIEEINEVAAAGWAGEQ